MRILYGLEEKKRPPDVVYRLLLPSGRECGGPVFYGAAVYCRQQEIMRVEDITTDRLALERLLRRCTLAGLSTCHFKEIIEDFVAEPEMM